VLDQWGDGSVGRSIIATMVDEHHRGVRFHGGGFYDYAEDGSRSIWPPLLDQYCKPKVDVPQQDIKDRLLFRQVIESLKCLEGGVLRSVQDGNIGSIMGIGAPVWTGGFIQFVNTYGLQRFIDRCDELAATCGERFKAPAIVSKKLADGKQFD
jgi:3-hydroxyacyl-CoA dehydrogenase/enoyl-CoA hydratase/3-hydroxybutyryl-CoA epimerase